MKRYVDKARLLKILSQFKKTRILVVGDIILDRYIWGKADRLSPEAPVPIVWANKENYRLGGSANVAYNLSSLGSRVSLSGVVGSDFYGKKLLDILKKFKEEKEG